QISDDEIKFLCEKSKEIFLSQPVLLELQAPINICGNICGQYTDLLRHFDQSGFPYESNYLFLGGYVNRGKQSLETICLLLAYKVTENGYEFFADRQLVTIFSTPDYVGEFDNAGALMRVDQNLMCSFMV
ncbi:unnamed protein product, partial [Adineta steineri]